MAAAFETNEQSPEPNNQNTSFKLWSELAPYRQDLSKQESAAKRESETYPLESTPEILTGENLDRSRKFQDLLLTYYAGFGREGAKLHEIIAEKEKGVFGPASESAKKLLDTELKWQSRFHLDRLRAILPEETKLPATTPLILPKIKSADGSERFMEAKHFFRTSSQGENLITQSFSRSQTPTQGDIELLNQALNFFFDCQSLYRQEKLKEAEIRIGKRLEEVAKNNGLESWLPAQNMTEEDKAHGRRLLSLFDQLNLMIAAGFQLEKAQYNGITVGGKFKLQLPPGLAQKDLQIENEEITGIRGLKRLFPETLSRDEKDSQIKLALIEEWLATKGREIESAYKELDLKKQTASLRFGSMDLPNSMLPVFKKGSEQFLRLISRHEIDSLGADEKIDSRPNSLWHSLEIKEIDDPRNSGKKKILAIQETQAIEEPILKTLKKEFIGKPSVSVRVFDPEESVFVDKGGQGKVIKGSQLKDYLNERVAIVGGGIVTSVGFDLGFGASGIAKIGSSVFGRRLAEQAAERAILAELKGESPQLLKSLQETAGRLASPYARATQFAVGGMQLTLGAAGTFDTAATRTDEFGAKAMNLRHGLFTADLMRNMIRMTPYLGPRLLNSWHQSSLGFYSGSAMINRTSQSFDTAMKEAGFLFGLNRFGHANILLAEAGLLVSLSEPLKDIYGGKTGAPNSDYFLQLGRKAEQSRSPQSLSKPDLDQAKEVLGKEAGSTQDKKGTQEAKETRESEAGKAAIAGDISTIQNVFEKHKIFANLERAAIAAANGGYVKHSHNDLLKFLSNSTAYIGKESQKQVTEELLNILLDGKSKFKYGPAMQSAVNNIAKQLFSDPDFAKATKNLFIQVIEKHEPDSKPLSISTKTDSFSLSGPEQRNGARHSPVSIVAAHDHNFTLDKNRLASLLSLQLNGAASNHDKFEIAKLLLAGGKMGALEYGQILQERLLSPELSREEKLALISGPMSSGQEKAPSLFEILSSINKMEENLIHANAGELAAAQSLLTISAGKPLYETLKSIAKDGKDGQLAKAAAETIYQLNLQRHELRLHLQLKQYEKDNAGYAKNLKDAIEAKKQESESAKESIPFLERLHLQLTGNRFLIHEPDKDGSLSLSFEQNKIEMERMLIAAESLVELETGSAKSEVLNRLAANLVSFAELSKVDLLPRELAAKAERANKTTNMQEQVASLQALTNQVFALFEKEGLEHLSLDTKSSMLKLATALARNPASFAEENYVTAMIAHATRLSEHGDNEGLQQSWLMHIARLIKADDPRFAHSSAQVRITSLDAIAQQLQAMSARKSALTDKTYNDLFLAVLSRSTAINESELQLSIDSRSSENKIQKPEVIRLKSGETDADVRVRAINTLAQFKTSSQLIAVQSALQQFLQYERNPIVAEKISQSLEKLSSTISDKSASSTDLTPVNISVPAELRILDGLSTELLAKWLKQASPLIFADEFEQEYLSRADAAWGWSSWLPLHKLSSGQRRSLHESMEKMAELADQERDRQIESLVALARGQTPAYAGLLSATHASHELLTKQRQRIDELELLRQTKLQNQGALSAAADSLQLEKLKSEIRDLENEIGLIKERSDFGNPQVMQMLAAELSRKALYLILDGRMPHISAGNNINNQRLTDLDFNPRSKYLKRQDIEIIAAGALKDASNLQGSAGLQAKAYIDRLLAKNNLEPQIKAILEGQMKRAHLKEHYSQSTENKLESLRNHIQSDQVYSILNGKVWSDKRKEAASKLISSWFTPDYIISKSSTIQDAAISKITDTVDNERSQALELLAKQARSEGEDPASEKAREIIRSLFTGLAQDFAAKGGEKIRELAGDYRLSSRFPLKTVSDWQKWAASELAFISAQGKQPGKDAYEFISQLLSRSNSLEQSSKSVLLTAFLAPARQENSATAANSSVHQERMKHIEKILSASLKSELSAQVHEFNDVFVQELMRGLSDIGSRESQELITAIAESDRSSLLSKESRKLAENLASKQAESVEFIWKQTVPQNINGSRDRQAGLRDAINSLQDTERSIEAGELIKDELSNSKPRIKLHESKVNELIASIAALSKSEQGLNQVSAHMLSRLLSHKNEKLRLAAARALVENTDPAILNEVLKSNLTRAIHELNIRSRSETIRQESYPLLLASLKRSGTEPIQSTASLNFYGMKFPVQTVYPGGNSLTLQASDGILKSFVLNGKRWLPAQESDEVSQKTSSQSFSNRLWIEEDSGRFWQGSLKLEPSGDVSFEPAPGSAYRGLKLSTKDSSPLQNLGEQILDMANAKSTRVALDKLAVKYPLLAEQEASFAERRRKAAVKAEIELYRGLSGNIDWLISTNKTIEENEKNKFVSVHDEYTKVKQAELDSFLKETDLNSAQGVWARHALVELLVLTGSQVFSKDNDKMLISMAAKFKEIAERKLASAEFVRLASKRILNKQNPLPDAARKSIEEAEALRSNY